MIVLLKTYKVGDTLEISRKYFGNKKVKTKAKIIKRGPNWIKISTKVMNYRNKLVTVEKTITKSSGVLLMDDGLYFKCQIWTKKLK